MIIKKVGEKNMKIWKILIGIGIIFLLIGTVYAADFVDMFKAPSPLHPMGTSSYVDEQGHNILISELDDETITTWLQNDTDPSYLVKEFNKTTYIATDDENDCYIHEVIEKDGKKYLISSWTPKGADETLIIQGNLEEFNKLNNLNPLEIERVI